jgi:hypothetical protein
MDRPAGESGKTAAIAARAIVTSAQAAPAIAVPAIAVPAIAAPVMAAAPVAAPVHAASVQPAANHPAATSPSANATAPENSAPGDAAGPQPSTGMTAMSEAPPSGEAMHAVDAPDQALTTPEPAPEDKKAKHHLASAMAGKRPTPTLGSMLRRIFNPPAGRSYYPNR